MSESNQSEVLPTVSARVLAAFVDAVAEDAAFAEVSERLKQTVLVDSDLTEAGLRKALFGGDEP